MLDNKKGPQQGADQRSHVSQWGIPKNKEGKTGKVPDRSVLWKSNSLNPIPREEEGGRKRGKRGRRMGAYHAHGHREERVTYKKEMFGESHRGQLLDTNEKGEGGQFGLSRTVVVSVVVALSYHLRGKEWGSRRMIGSLFLSDREIESLIAKKRGTN